MSFVYILKILADIFFYLTFANFFVIAFGVPFNVILVPPIIYIIYSIAIHSKFSTSFEYSHIFSLYIRMFIPFALIMILIARSIFETASLPYALGFFTTSVVLMRLLRQQTQVQKRFWYKLINLLTIVAVVFGGFIISSRLALNIITTVLSTLYFYIIVPGFLLFLRLVLFIISPLVEFLLRFIDHENPEDLLELYGGSTENVEAFIFDVTIATAITGAIALFFIAAVVYFVSGLNFSQLIKFTVKTNSTEEIFRQFIPATKKAKISKKWDNSTQWQLQKQYRKFLQLCWKNNIPKATHLTSKDYQQLVTAKFKTEEASIALREIYIPVRYGEKAAERVDVISAGKLNAQIKEKIRNGKIVSTSSDKPVC
ncbi:MAG: hypothetical protein FWC91_06735 [Defluviitaleaceae bacterium]|nr:hypothetical protein [Defluviitaleaceae bacterium]